MSSWNSESLEFECLDRELGDRMPELADDTLAPSTRRELERHLEICHACAEKWQFEAFIAENLAARRGWLHRLAGRRWRAKAFVVLAAAVSIVLVLTLPAGQGYKKLLIANAAKDAAGSFRASPENEFFLLSPLEGEVLYRQSPHLEWTHVEKASFYEVRVEWGDKASGQGFWRDSVRTCKLTLPDSLYRQGVFLAIVKPYPEGLVAQGEESVSFRRGNLFAFLTYRLAHPPLLSLLFMLAALAMGCVLIFRRK